MNVELGAPEDLPAFVTLLEEAGAWLWARGIHQWAAGSNRAQEPLMRAQVEEGALLAVRDGSGLLGGCLLTREPYGAWHAHAGDAAYLHKLVVARRAAGRSLGERILGAAEAWTGEAALPHLRLDCWEGNATLRSYYRDRGFRELEAAEEHGYAVRLFEKAIRA